MNKETLQAIDDCRPVLHRAHRLAKAVGNQEAARLIRESIRLMPRQKHGLSHTIEFRTWSNIIQRCTNPRASFYELYGGRGIIICDRWRASFEAFLADMGPKPSLDVNGNYEPGNCRWATPHEQARNTRRTRYMIVNGVTVRAIEWRASVGMTRSAYESRREAGWTDEEIASTPVRVLGRLTHDQKQEIAGRYEHGESIPSISRRMNVPYSTVYRVARAVRRDAAISTLEHVAGTVVRA